jgi:hypothetical protein
VLWVLQEQLVHEDQKEILVNLFEVLLDLQDFQDLVVKQDFKVLLYV